jgi:hypothetical protein
MIRHLPGIYGTSIEPRDVEEIGREDLTKPREIAAYEWLRTRLGVFESVLTSKMGGRDDTPAAKVQKMRGHMAAFNDLRASGR